VNFTFYGFEVSENKCVILIYVKQRSRILS
jgi:hypothetical protein